MTDTEYFEQIAENTTELVKTAVEIKEAIELGSGFGFDRRTQPGLPRKDDPDPARIIPLSYLLHKQQQGGAVGTRPHPHHAANGDEIGQAMLEFVHAVYALDNADKSYYWGMSHWTKDEMRPYLRMESPYFPDTNAGPYIDWKYQGIDPEFSGWQ